MFLCKHQLICAQHQQIDECLESLDQTSLDTTDVRIYGCYMANSQDYD